VYNQERFIVQCIESALCQRYSNYEIIAVNDGSTDGTAATLEKYRKAVRVIHKNNGGTSSCWNLALQSIDSEYVIGLDSDDEFCDNTIERVIDQALEVPTSSVIYSDYVFIDPKGNTIKTVRNPQPFDPIGQLINLHDRLGEPDNFVPFGHVRLYRTNIFHTIHGFDESYKYAEDFDLLLRLAENRVEFSRVPEILYRYRWHDSNKGVVTRNEQITEVRRSVCEFYQRHKEYSEHAKK
jgi:glycosyltransferase involved in cell wall biosynthesis